MKWTKPAITALKRGHLRGHCIQKKTSVEIRAGGNKLPPGTLENQFGGSGNFCHNFGDPRQRRPGSSKMRSNGPNRL